MTDPFNPQHKPRGYFFELVETCEHGKLDRHKVLIAEGPHGATRTESCAGARRTQFTTWRILLQIWKNRNLPKGRVER